MIESRGCLACRSSKGLWKPSGAAWSRCAAQFCDFLDDAALHTSPLFNHFAWLPTQFIDLVLPTQVHRFGLPTQFIDWVSPDAKFPIEFHRPAKGGKEFALAPGSTSWRSRALLMTDSGNFVFSGALRASQFGLLLTRVRKSKAAFFSFSRSSWSIW